MRFLKSKNSHFHTNRIKFAAERRLKHIRSAHWLISTVSTSAVAVMYSRSAMTNDRTRWLGWNGESFFQNLALRAGFVVNRCERDVEGWDFLVELPRSVLAGVSRDLQPSAIKCMVQVKATDRAAAEGVDIPLFNWEQWSQVPLPVFVAVVGFGEQNTAAEMYLCHIDKSRIVSTLERIRRMEAEKNIDMSRKMRLKPYTTESVDLQHDKTLESAVRNCAGHDLALYTQAKGVLLKTVGFTKKPIRLSFQTSVGIASLVDATLGLTPLRVDRLEVATVRFGIGLPDDSLEDVLVRMTPAAVGAFELVLASRVARQSVRLRGEVFIPPIPDLPRNLRKTVFRAGCIQIVYSADGGTFDMNFDPKILNTIDNIISNAKAGQIIQYPDRQVQINFHGRTSRCPVSGEAPMTKYFEKLIARALPIQKTLKQFAMTEILMRADDLFDQDRRLSWIWLLNNRGTIQLGTIDLPNHLLKRKTEGVLATITPLRLGNTTYAFPSIWRAMMSRDDRCLSALLSKSNNLNPFEVEGDELPPSNWENLQTEAACIAGSKPLLIYEQHFEEERPKNATLLIEE